MKLASELTIQELICVILTDVEITEERVESAKYLAEMLIRNNIYVEILE